MSRSHQRAEHILKNLQQEEEKRRLGREASIITAIPVAQEACYEPTCSPPPEQEEEGGDTSHRLVSVCVCFCVCMLLLILIPNRLSPPVGPPSRRSGEPDIAPPVRQPLLRLQQLSQELLVPPRLRLVRALAGQC